VNCESCTEFLADFLLDELPETQAVLVQEHLNICPGCMRAYKELKGTGKALEAVPALRPVEASEQFGQAVRAGAAAELANIVAKLPPEKRLRLEVRRAARNSVAAPRVPPPPRPLWSNPVLMLAVAGVVIVVAVMLHKPGNTVVSRQSVARLTALAGKVEQFFQRQNEPHSPAREGREIFSGDIYSAQENGCARMDLNGGGSLLLGPRGTLSFRATAENAEAAYVELEKGELGVQLAASTQGETGGGTGVEIRAGVFRFQLSAGACAYFTVAQAGRDKSVSVDVRMLRGSAQVLRQNGEKVAQAGSLQRVVCAPGANPVPEGLDDARVPVWRAALISDEELAGCVGGGVKVLGRGLDGVDVELSYSGANTGGLGDWQGESPENFLVRRADGLLSLPSHGRFRHVLPLGAPLTFETRLDARSSSDASFAFGVFKTASGGVSVDVEREAVLTVKSRGGDTRSSALPARAQKGQAEKLRLDIVREASGQLSAVLNISDRRSKDLPIARDAETAGGEVWLQGLGEGILFSDIHIEGRIPAGWLRERLSVR
jgi:hypothetical protein